MLKLRHRVVRMVVAFAAALAVSSAASAQVSVADLTAAFLYNFARFTEWPAEVLPAGSPIVLCVVGDQDVAQALGRAVNGKAISGHGLVVRRVAADTVLLPCHLLYAGNIDVRQAQRLLDAVKQAPVLTVSDLGAFTSMGGAARLFMEGDRMRFTVNVAAAQRSSVHISAQLLNLAKIVKDGHASR
jgi:hypothetical protein